MGKSILDIEQLNRTINALTGYSMAKNLREKIPKEDTLYIQDVNTNATAKFVSELPGFDVIVAKSAREVAEKAVSTNILIVSSQYNDETLFSFFQFYELSRSLNVPL